MIDDNTPIEIQIVPLSSATRPRVVAVNGQPLPSPVPFEVGTPFNLGVDVADFRSITTESGMTPEGVLELMAPKDD